MPLLYDTGLRLYRLAVRCAAPWNPKARAWLRGRATVWEELERKSEVLRGCLWMHCASVGEFEQGRPVLEALKAERPDLPVLITFFSPSGYEARKDLPWAAHVGYLPIDNAANAERMLQLIVPRAAVFVKYEFWYHYLNALRDKQVPTFLISAIFRKNQPFFRWYGAAWREMLGCFSHIFTQNEASRTALATIGISRTSVSGDTRFDRVAAIVRSAPVLPLAAAFAGRSPTLVAGSTWPPDEELLVKAFAGSEKVPKCIIAPHELKSAQLQAIEDLFPRPVVRWTDLERTGPENVLAMFGNSSSGTLLVDRMGLLATLYGHGQVAYVGGGFTDGIHSLLEAAAWGVPVLFGPNHRKFAEAQGLIDAGAGKEVRNAQALRDALRQWLDDPKALEEASAQARRYVQERTGATDHVMAVLLKAL